MTDAGARRMADSKAVEGVIRRLVAQHACLAVNSAALVADADLHDAGLSSFASVQLMLAIEDEFDLEFPERLLNRSTFRSIAALARAVDEIRAARLCE
jgi:acyl carrier protein